MIFKRENNMKYGINKYLIILGIFILYTGTFAQGFNASGLAMGNAYGALARGVDAFAWNPANLALSHDNLLEINLIGFNVNVANSSFSIDDYKRYFTESGHHGHWDTQDVNDILDLIPDDGLDVSADAYANAIGILFDRYGFSVQGVGKSIGVMPKSLVELVLKGNQELYKEYSINDFDGSGYSALKFSLSLSHPIPFKKYFDEFAVGLNVNYYYGIAVAEVISANGAVVTTNDTILNSVDIAYRTGQSGGGIGFDIGAAGKIQKKWTASLALKNLFATVNWNNENWEYRIYASKTGISIEDVENSTEDIFEVDTVSTDPFKTTIPVVFHLGLAYDFLDNLVFTMDLDQAFANKLGYSDRAQIAFGAQYNPIALIPLRAGMSFGGKYKYLFGVGFGIHAGFFNFDLAYAMHQGLWPTKTSGFSTAANIKLVF